MSCVFRRRSERLDRLHVRGSNGTRWYHDAVVAGDLLCPDELVVALSGVHHAVPDRKRVVVPFCSL